MSPASSFDRAAALYQSGRLDEAAGLCQEIIKAEPKHADALNLAGVIFYDVKQYDKAMPYVQAAVIAQPMNPMFHHNIGRILLAQGNRTEAKKAFERTLKIEPKFSKAFKDLVRTMFEDDQWVEAEKWCAFYVSLFPTIPEIIGLLVKSFKEQKKYLEMLPHCARIVELNPNYPDPQFYTHYALALECTGRLRESIHYHHKILSMVADPTKVVRSELYYNIALAHDSLGEFDEAKQYYEKTLELDPGHSKCRFALQSLLIKTSDLKEGYETYSTRLELPDRVERNYPFPQWHGESLKGKKLLIWSEQGIGDIAMFASFIPYLLKQTTELTIEMFPPLVPLFKRSFPDVDVFTLLEGTQPSQEVLAKKYDLHAAMGDLMAFLLKEYTPNVVRGFLKPEPNRLKQLKERYAALGPGLKVGISWRTIHPDTRFRRNIPLEAWGEILTTPNCHFISLQYSNEKEELEYARKLTGVPILLDEDVQPIQNKDDFVAQIAAMDVIVSIQNSTVHMAGATGIDTILMLSKAGDFRWGATLSKSLFYPSISIVRQKEYGEWQQVIDEAAVLLRERVKAVAA